MKEFNQREWYTNRMERHQCRGTREEYTENFKERMSGNERENQMALREGGIKANEDGASRGRAERKISKDNQVLECLGLCIFQRDFITIMTRY